jgi:hypothetical protein
MAVTVEIKTGSCWVIEYLLSPLLRYAYRGDGRPFIDEGWWCATADEDGHYCFAMAL